uniref:Uncharacterized protein n=1 Tax=viral metagenome TaxID=1070528 RepID=A0A6C0CAC2_9ZZZZ
MNVSLFLEIKEEYTEHLIDALAPFLCEGLNSMYGEAEDVAIEGKVANEKLLMIFQKLLQHIKHWDQGQIDKEAYRIKQDSGTAAYLDDLVKAVIKTNIILLTYSNTISNVIGQSYYNSITTSQLIHKCYIECAKDAHNNPYLFLRHGVNQFEIKRNQVLIQQNVQYAIQRAIRKMLPISVILKEYLANTINIIAEAPNVELMGVPAAPYMPAVIPPIDAPIKPPSEIDPKIQQEVMKIIKSEHIKSEKQKIQDIMNIDKLITSLAPPEKSVQKQEGGKLQIKKVESESTAYENKGLNKSDKRIININFDPSEPNKSSISRTSMTSGYSRTAEFSERVDPDNADYIEEYGSEMSGNNKNRKYR